MGAREADMHFLKGSCLNLGFMTLGQVCEEAEQRAGKGSLTEACVACVIETYETSRHAFVTGLAAA